MVTGFKKIVLEGVFFGGRGGRGIVQKEYVLAMWKYLSAFGMKDHKHIYR